MRAILDEAAFGNGAGVAGVLVINLSGAEIAVDGEGVIAGETGVVAHDARTAQGGDRYVLVGYVQGGPAVQRNGGVRKSQ